MKDLFPGYYGPESAEKKKLLQTAKVCVDANVLLNLYRYSKETRETWLEILSDLKKEGRLWITYQAAKEYHVNRIPTIIAEARGFDNAIKHLEGVQKKVLESLPPPDGRKRFSGECLERWEKLLGPGFEKIRKDILAQKEKHPDFLEKDTIRASLDEILEDCIGGEPTDLLQRIAIVEGRYSRSVPPGYVDAKTKSGEEKFGDALIWLEMIDKANEGHDIIFVTDDGKEDWWISLKGEQIGPRPELVAEFSKTKKVYHQYTPEQFLRFSKGHSRVSAETIEETKNVSRAQGFWAQYPKTLSELARLGDVVSIADMEKKYGIPDRRNHFSHSEWGQFEKGSSPESLYRKSFYIDENGYPISNNQFNSVDVVTGGAGTVEPLSVRSDTVIFPPQQKMTLAELMNSKKNHEPKDPPQ